MYFEDEKDIIDDSANLHIAEDGTVSWDDILNDQADDAEVQADVLEDDSMSSADIVIDDSPADTAVNDAGGVESIRNDINPSEIEYDDNPLNSADVTTADDISNQYGGEEYSSEDNISDDFDIDKQLEQLSGSEAPAENDDFQMPSKEKKKTSSTPLLLALLVAVLVMAGIYYYFTNFQNIKDELVKPSTKTEMDNMTQDKLEERNAEAEENADAQASADNAPIPIVNDDNVEELKPEEKPKEEKKQVIAIIPTGRTNPFLPLQKYSKVDVNETIIQYDKVGIPTPPDKMPEKNKEAIRMLTISVSGIMYDNQKPSAIITLDNNDYFVQKGDKLDEYKVIDIGRNFVTVALGNNLYRANIGEEFKITSKFPGSAQYMPAGQGGGRQYYSIGEKKDADDDMKKKPASGARYVSDEEIVIKTKEKE